MPNTCNQEKNGARECVYVALGSTMGLNFTESAQENFAGKSK